MHRNVSRLHRRRWIDRHKHDKPRGNARRGASSLVKAPPLDPEEPRRAPLTSPFASPSSTSEPQPQTLAPELPARSANREVFLQPRADRARSNRVHCEIGIAKVHLEVILFLIRFCELLESCAFQANAFS